MQQIELGKPQEVPDIFSLAGVLWAEDRIHR